MKALINYIIEAIKIGKSASNISVYTCQPKDKKELIEIIDERIKSEGPNCDLNDIDVSNITDMSNLFEFLDFNNCNISKWDVSNVTNMHGIFYGCESFNQDISTWDISKVTDMSSMFFNCESFNQNISNWDVSKVKTMYGIFGECNIEDKYKPKFK